MSRLYFADSTLGAGLFELSAEQRHYLATVLRLRAGAEVSLFNGREGEWKGRLHLIDKKHGVVELMTCLRSPEPVTPLQLVFAPLKSEQQRFLIEKSTELGATAFLPVITQRTVNQFSFHKAQAHILAATQQCERLDLPDLHQPQKLVSFLDAWPPQVPLFVADERGWGRVPPLMDVLTEKAAAFLIGPEGGFAPTEWDIFDQCAFVKRVTLGSRILRAETAALMCLAVFQGFISK